MSNPFSGVSKAQVSETGSYFPYAKGRYTCTIERVLIKPSRKSGDLFTVEMCVEESSHPEVGEGEIKTWQLKMSNVDTTPGNLKLFALAATGCKANDPEAVNKALKTLDQTLLDACEKGVLNGKRVVVHTDPITTKSGSQFTKLTFGPA